MRATIMVAIAVVSLLPLTGCSRRPRQASRAQIASAQNKEFSNHPVGVIKTRRPLITKAWNGSVRAEHSQIFLDGKDITKVAKCTDWSIRYEPDSDLPLGAHEVRVNARSKSGAIIHDSWRFQIVSRDKP